MKPTNMDIDPKQIGILADYPRKLTQEETDYISDKYVGLDFDVVDSSIMWRDELGNVYVQGTAQGRLEINGVVNATIRVAQIAAAMCWLSDYSEVVRPTITRVNNNPDKVCILLTSKKGVGEPALPVGWDTERIDNIIEEGQDL